MLELEDLRSRIRTIQIADDSAKLARNVMQVVDRSSLEDLTLIPKMYEVFLSLADRKPSLREPSVYNREKFMYVIVLLYSPLVFCGRKMKTGLRDTLASCMGLTAQSTVSNNIRDAIFNYDVYPEFREDVKVIWEALNGSIDALH